MKRINASLAALALFALPGSLAAAQSTMSVEETRAAIMPYFDSHHTNLDAMAEDVVFTIMATGERYEGREAVSAMLDYFYRGAFEADATLDTILIGEGSAAVEGRFIGTHVGEFAGIPATGKEVDVPIAVFYTLRDGKIVEGRSYFEMPVLLAQLGAAP